MVIGKKKSRLHLSTISETSLLLLLLPLLLFAEKKNPFAFLFIFFILILIIFHAVLTTEMFPCLFVCLFIFKIERAYCPESLRRRCQRRKSQYLSLLCFYVYLFIYMFIGIYFLGAQSQFLTTDHYQMIKSTGTN